MAIPNQKKAPHLLHTSAGFTLIEVLIAGAVMTVILLALSSQIVSSTKSAASIEKILVFNELVMNIQHVVSDQTLCASSLTGTLPLPNQSLQLLYGSQKINDLPADPGSRFQGQILITQLKWAEVTSLSPTQKLG